MAILKKPAGTPIDSVAKDSLKGAEAFYEGHKAIAHSDYNFYKQTEGEMHKHQGFNCVNWDEYGETFEESYNNWMKDVLEGKWKPC